MLLLVTVFIPSEYAIDPTGMSCTLGLSQMSEINGGPANFDTTEILTTSLMFSITAMARVEEGVLAAAFDSKHSHPALGLRRSRATALRGRLLLADSVENPAAIFAQERA